MKYTRIQTTCYKIDEKELKKFLVDAFGEEEAEALFSNEENLREWIDEYDFLDGWYADTFVKVINYNFESELE